MLQSYLEQQAHTRYPAVQIAEPVPEYRTFDDDIQTTKQFRATHGRRLSGKLAPSPQFGSSGRPSTNDDTPSLRPTDDGVPTSSQHQRQQYYSEKMVAQIGDWLERQQSKQARRKKKKHQANGAPKSLINGQDLRAPDLTPDALKSHDDQGADLSMPDRKRSDSVGSQESDVSLDRLQRIVDDSMVALGMKPSHRFSPRSTRPPRSRRRSLVRASSDTDYVDGDVVVPDCDVRLDNSKTVSFCYSDTGENPPTDENSTQAQVEAWRSFKNEIIRTAHTLRLKGWRRIELGSGDSIEVERISGALTNAVYAVTPPSDLPKIPGRKQPPKLLLRIYGPQVEQLIDRENELKVLQRLARKKIGPRLLGTFLNGRFEQFFNASPLTPVELRDPDTSKQIAKRMRELHDGIELLSSERDDGPSVWKSWDSWRDNATRIMRYVDKRVEAQAGPNQRRPSSVINAWKDRGYVCGVPWPQFVETVLKYRAFIQGFYKGEKVINDNLVFAHNDVSVSSGTA
jgi:choline kinase